MNSCFPRRFWRSIGSFDRLLDALLPQQASSTQVQIRECEVYGQPMRIFQNATIANLCEAKDPLENVEDMLNTRAHSRFRTIRFALSNGKILGTRRMRLREVRRVRRIFADHCGLTAIRRIAPHTRFITIVRARRMMPPSARASTPVRVPSQSPPASLFSTLTSATARPTRSGVDVVGIDGDTIDATRVPAELPFESPLRRSHRPHRARPVAPFAVLVCERQVPCQTRFDAGIPEFRTVERRHPRAFDEAHESVRTYACRLIAVHSQDQNRRVARDPFRSRASRHCNFGFAICDHVPAERRHLRIVRYATDTSVPERSFATTRMVADRYVYAAVIAGFSSLGHSAFAKPTDLRVSRWSSTPPMLRK